MRSYPVVLGFLVVLDQFVNYDCDFSYPINNNNNNNNNTNNNNNNNNDL